MRKIKKCAVPENVSGEKIHLLKSVIESNTHTYRLLWIRIYLINMKLIFVRAYETVDAESSALYKSGISALIFLFSYSQKSFTSIFVF